MDPRIEKLFGSDEGGSLHDEKTGTGVFVGPKVPTPPGGWKETVYINSARFRRTGFYEEMGK